MRWVLPLIGISLLLLHSLQAQQSNERCKWVSRFNEPISLDSLTIFPDSFILSDSNFTVHHDLSVGRVTIKGPDGADSVRVCFKVMPYRLHQRYFHRSLNVYDSNAYFKDPIVEGGNLQREELFPTHGLEKSGSISRGISFGNNQDVFVNSTFNLNLNGKLTDDLNIRASITDQNVPYQPEGNTQQLQDFDNVYIQIYNDKFSLTGGDIVLKNRSSHFLRYYKNVQGGLAEVNYQLGNTQANTTVGLSVAKGRFASVQLAPEEGLSGPYRIPGPDGQPFVIILANSERVFLDGTRLERGFNNDYVIDYNSGEITFTSRVLITQFSRIRIDYEYADQNYNRTIAAVDHEHQMGNLKVGIHSYSEKDSRNRPLATDLTNLDKQLLSQIGDQTDLAFKEGVDSVAFSEDRILYQKIDTMATDNAAHTIYKYSTDPANAFYTLTFNDVGQGHGNYELVNNTANGRVYAWVAPVAGEPQGRYEPVIRMAAPNKKQMTTVTVEYAFNEHEIFFSEVALSTKDDNLFSTLGDEDDRGYAYKLGMVSKDREVTFLRGYQWAANVDFEFDDQYFNPIDRFRYIEYDRDWSYNPATQTTRYDDHILNMGVKLQKDANNKMTYALSHRSRGPQVDGFQHQAQVYQRLGRIQLRSDAFYLNTDNVYGEARWKRYFGDISYGGGQLIPGYRYSVDENVEVANETDSIRASAMHFNEHLFYVKNGDSARFDFSLSHALRNDKLPVAGVLRHFTESQTTRLGIGKDLKNNNLDLIFTYRILDDDINDMRLETVAGRIDWRGSWLKQHIKSELTYVLSNSREPRREYIFIRVPAGEGTHTWRDLNEDGVQDLTEFFEAINIDERNYAKFYTPTTTFVTAFQNMLVYRISLSMPRAWRGKDGIRSFLSRFSNSTSWSADTKTTEDDFGTRLLAFARDISPDLLLAERNILRSTLFYNRAHPRYGLELTYTDTEQRQLLANGFEARESDEISLNIRYNFGRVYNIRLRSSTTHKVVASDFLAGRNYDISGYKLNPEFSWQPQPNFRFIIQYGYLFKENRLDVESPGQAETNEFAIEIKYNRAITNNLNARIRLVNIQFEGEENTPVGYELLQALRPGRNVTWAVNWQQKITNGLQLNLSYDGRKSADSRMIHVGRVQVSALF